ncbi:MAG: VanW family protein [Muribaculaceae bacterium]|nr:VanW family protein [Muribaculaceae bacterium]
MARKLFCEIAPWAYTLSVKKQVFQRHLKNIFTDEKFSANFDEKPLPEKVASWEGNIIKKGPGIDPVSQQNKAENIRLACKKLNGIIIKPGETFSFWKLIGKTSESNGFKSGRVLVNGKLTVGLGGGLCNLANTLHLLFMQAPLTITELHHHSDALAPDPDWKRVPYSAGTSVNYNYLDLRFRNETDQCVQILASCPGDTLVAELRAEKPFPVKFRITEEGHHFHKSKNGNYYRLSKIYREQIDAQTGEVTGRELKWDNRSRVMFDPALIPKERIR